MPSQPGRPRTNGPRCGAKTRNGTCRNAAGERTSHPGYGTCYRHGGCTPDSTKHAEKLMAEEAAERFGVPVETTAQDALLDLLAFAQGKVDFYRAQVKRLTPDQMVGGTIRIQRTRKHPGQPDELVEDITTAQTTKNIWVVLLDEAEKHLLNVAGTIGSLGIEVERVKLAKEQGAMWHRLLLQVLEAYGIPADDPKLPGVVQRVIGELEPS